MPASDTEILRQYAALRQLVSSPEGRLEYFLRQLEGGNGYWDLQEIERRIRSGADWERQFAIGCARLMLRAMFSVAKAYAKGTLSGAQEQRYLTVVDRVKPFEHLLRHNGLQLRYKD